MKRIKRTVVLIFWFLNAAIAGLGQNQNSLADLYKTGNIRLVPEMTLDENSMGGDYFFQGAIDIEMDEEGNIYISDYRAHNIKKFDAAGGFVKVIGRQGQGPGELGGPWEIAVSNGRLFVWEMGNRRLSALTTDGDYIKSISFQVSDGRPEKVEALPDGNVVVDLEKIYFQDTTRPQDRKIVIYSPDLEPIKTLYSQQIWRNKYMTVEGMFMNIPQPFAHLAYWDVSPGGGIVIGYSKEYVIDLYDSDKGKVSSFSHRFKPVRITDSEKQRFFANFNFGTSDGKRQKGAPDIVVKNTDFPKNKPSFSRIFVDGEGNVLVKTHRDQAWEESLHFDAFTPTGDYIGNVEILEKSTFLDKYSPLFFDRFVWVTESDEEGLTRIVKYRISG